MTRAAEADAEGRIAVGRRMPKQTRVTAGTKISRMLLVMLLLLLMMMVLRMLLEMKGMPGLALIVKTLGTVRTAVGT